MGKMLNNPNKTKILLALKNGETNLSKIAADLKLTKACVSNHVRNFIEEGVVSLEVKSVVKEKTMVYTYKRMGLDKKYTINIDIPSL